MRVSPHTKQIISEVELSLSDIYGQIRREISRLEELPGTRKYIKRVCLLPLSRLPRLKAGRLL